MAILTRGYNSNEVNNHLILYWNGTRIAAQMSKKSTKKAILILHYKYYKHMKEAASEQ